MALTQAIAIGGVQLFKLRLLGRMQALARETGEASFVMPLALLLLADEASGGCITARELAKRFTLSDFEARNLIDFYFPGWSASGAKRSPVDLADMRFDLRSCDGFREALRAAGVKGLGGDGELILVDASYVKGTVRLNFAGALRIVVADTARELRFASAGAFLQSMIDTVERLRNQGSAGAGATFTWSDQLALAVAKRSLLEGFIDQWCAFLGTAKLAELALRDLGPDLPLIEL